MYVGQGRLRLAWPGCNGPCVQAAPEEYSQGIRDIAHVRQELRGSNEEERGILWEEMIDQEVRKISAWNEWDHQTDLETQIAALDHLIAAESTPYYLLDPAYKR